MTDLNPHNEIAAASDPSAAESLATAGVVHDVNQMLAVITGRAGLLLKRLQDPAVAPHLQAILLAAGDAAIMLRRLNIVAAGTTVAVGSSLSAAVEQARLLVWPDDDAAFAWQVDLAADLHTTVPASVLREVLTNLLLTALAVMPDRGQVVCSAETAADDRILLRVTDSGPGLPSGDPENVFARGVTGSGQPGRGIGLAGCRQLLAGVGGGLKAEAGLSGGATFVLDLPAYAGAVVTATEDVAPVPVIDVLVVDDEAVVRDMLHDVLREWGCRVQTCRDSQSTLAQYAPGSAVVAIIDRNLPGLSGLELATRLRDDDPCLSIVMLSGWQEGGGPVPADSAVVDHEAHKPIEMTEIRNILIKGDQLNQARRDAASPK